MAESTTPASIAATSAIASNPPASGPASVSEKNGGSPKPAANSNPAASVLEVGSLTEKATKRVVPPYPQIAKSAGASGLVRVKVVVDESGSVSSINWVEGPLLLRQAAQDAVRQWKFKPTLLEGKPVRVAGFIDFGFSR
jgi:protein TonB